MGKITSILWTNKSWNPFQGCHKISPGCKNRYMFSDKIRYGQQPNVVVRSKPPTFNAPLKWKEPAMVCTCSWSDWFVEEADPWRDEARDIIPRTPHLTYQILTKRIDRAASWIPGIPDPNVWLGVSVEDRKYGLPRIDILRELPAAVRFLSIEPQLEDLGTINLDGIHWVICGGESGNSARPFDIDWVRDILKQCRAAGIPLFVKQFGAMPWDSARTARGQSALVQLSHPKGENPREWPEEFRVQQFPPAAYSENNQYLGDR